MRSTNLPAVPAARSATWTPKIPNPGLPIQLISLTSNNLNLYIGGFHPGLLLASAPCAPSAPGNEVESEIEPPCEHQVLPHHSWPGKSGDLLADAH